jgi:hypothetical protein
MTTPKPKGPNDVRPTKEFQSWPKWLTGPEGQRKIFNSEEEVPEGWMDAEDYAAEHEDDEPNGGGEDAEDSENGEDDEPEGDGEDTDDQEGEKQPHTVDSLVDNNTADQLIAMLEEMQKVDENVEFLASWPKPKLAKAILDNGGPLES